MVLGVNIVCSQMLKCCLFPRFYVVSVLLQIKMSFKYSLFSTVTFFRKENVGLVHISVLALLLIDPWLYISSPFKYHFGSCNSQNVHVKTFTSKGSSQFFDNVTLSTSAASILN